MFNKKGAQNLAVVIMGVILGLFVLAFLILTFKSDGSSSSAVNTISDFVSNTVGPLLKFILIPDNVSDVNQFLIVLTFILMCIIITGTLDSVNIFGGSNTTGNFMNLAVGIIVSIIGVRFMPADIWGSLTAPSSALVAAVLMGIPFVALTFISMKLKSRLASKLLWLFYIVFLSYLIFEERSSFLWAYLIFLILSVVMLFFDSTARSFFYKEKAAVEMSNMIGNLNVKQKYKIRREIEEYNNILGDASATPADIAVAKKKLLALEKLYGDLSVI